MLNDTHDASWLLTLAAGDLNREGSPSPTNTVARVKTGYRSASFVYRRSLRIGEIQAAVGLESFEDDLTDEDDQDWQASLNWHHDW
jgi:hypothetical protein